VLVEDRGDPRPQLFELLVDVGEFGDEFTGDLLAGFADLAAWPNGGDPPARCHR
jgi:hypothetical protein